MARPDWVYENIYAPFMSRPGTDDKNMAYRMYWNRLTEMSMQRFEWVGLPESVDARFIEQSLLFHGLVVYFHDPTTGRHLALRGTPAGQMNMYDNPVKFRVTGTGYPGRNLEPSEGVPIWPNYMRVPEIEVVQYYAKRLAEADRTIDINMMQQRHPFLVTADDTDRHSVSQIWKAVADGEFAIFPTRSINMSEVIQSLDTGIDKELVLNGILAKKKIWDECMTMLGIDNGNQEKKERMISDEVNANMGQVVSARNVALNTRLEGARNINRMFDGMEVDVRWRVVPQATMDIEDDSSGMAAI